ncbi:MAG TPA: hypothetical protein VNW95_02475 [Mucilaginibacter sp.]|jgi:hypothetical protein|nr:hypothetical protein [Mucilaginibacter sp.]
MKTITLIFSLLVAGCTMSFAQCEKNLVLTSSKTEHMNADGVVQRTDDETAKIELTKTAINVSVNDEHKITGTIKSQTCDWKVPFKEGKTVIKAAVSNDQGEERNVTITIEGKEGKVTLLFEMDGMPDDRIRVGIDKFAEKS